MAKKHWVIEWLPWLPGKSCYINLEFFETSKDMPDTSEGFRFVAFVVLEILGVGVLFYPPLSAWCEYQNPWCLKG